MKKYFVTGIGTEVGKTYFTAMMTRRLRKEDKKVIALKPIISGFNPANIPESDTGILLAAQELPLSPKNIEATSPWRFLAPIAPDMAAESEKRSIDFPQLVSFCQTPREADYVFIEGAGGVMSPFDHSHTMLDLAAAIDCKIILIGGNYLGAISHLLTAYQALSVRNLNPYCIILNESLKSPVPIEKTMLTLKRFLPMDLPVYCIARDASEKNFSSFTL